MTAPVSYVIVRRSRNGSERAMPAVYEDRGQALRVCARLNKRHSHSRFDVDFAASSRKQRRRL